jgi:hypothetical protein
MKTTKIRIENTKDFKGQTINVFKSNFEIYDFIGGYFGICLKGSFGSNCVFAGDSAWEDSYDKNLIKDIFNQWDGTLVYSGEEYGYKIEL